MRITFNKAERRLFVTNMAAVNAAESWERLNPGQFTDVKVVYVHRDDEPYNAVAFYEEPQGFMGWLAEGDNR